MPVISCWVDYDRGAVHDEKQNAYGFLFDNVKVILLPNKEVELLFVFMNLCLEKKIIIRRLSPNPL